MDDSFPVIISYFTENGIYEKEVRGLIDSCAELNLKTDIEKVADLGSWEKNCAFKPMFIYEKLKKHKKAVLWLDSDAAILKEPVFYKNASFDFSLLVNENFALDDPTKIFTSAIFVNYTEKALKLMEKWKDKTLFLNNKRLKETF